jgi:very-short-patch-repair endonuclease
MEERAQPDPHDERRASGRDAHPHGGQPVPEAGGERAGRAVHTDEVLARIAGAQRGVVGYSQALAAGVSRRAVERRAASGHLRRVHRGVYVVGHGILAPLARETAALLACGDRAVLSHRSAAVLWRLIDADDEQPVDVSLQTRSARRRDGIRVHRPAELRDEEVRTVAGLPVTAPARTLLDLAPVLGARDLERVVAEAQVRRLVRPGDLRGRGSRAIDALLDDGPRLTRSEAERRLLSLVRAARLPAPRTNVRVAAFEVDALWEAQRLAVEVDGFAFHGHRRAWERDHRRDLALQAAGLRTLRLTWRQLVDEPEAVVAALARGLAG